MPMMRPMHFLYVHAYCMLVSYSIIKSHPDCRQADKTSQEFMHGSNHRSLFDEENLFSTTDVPQHLWIEFHIIKIRLIVIACQLRGSNVCGYSVFCFKICRTRGVLLNSSVFFVCSKKCNSYYFYGSKICFFKTAKNKAYYINMQCRISFVFALIKVKIV